MGLTFAECPIARVARLAGAAVPPHGVEAECVLIASVLAAVTLVMLCDVRGRGTVRGPAQTVSASDPRLPSSSAADTRYKQFCQNRNKAASQVTNWCWWRPRLLAVMDTPGTFKL